MRSSSPFLGARLLALVVVAASLVPACVDDDPYGGITFEGEFGQPVPFELSAGLMFIDVSVDGTEARPFIVDTGAQYVLLDEPLAQELGYSATPSVVDQIEVGGVRFAGVEAVPFDLTAISETLGAEVDGILGASLLQYFTAVIDHGDQVFALLDEDDEVAADLVDSSRVEQEPSTAAFEVHLGLVLTDVSFESAPAEQLIVDTGASSTAVFQSYYDSLDRDDRPLLVGGGGLSAAGTFSVDLSRFCGVDVGDAHAPDVPVGVIDDDSLGDIRTIFPDVVGLVGYTFIREFLTVIDYPERTARFYRFTDRSHILEDEFIQVGLTLQRLEAGVVVVSTVYEGTDAEAKGVEVGDRVLSIDDEPVDSMSLGEMAAALTGEVGDLVALELEGGGPARTVDVLVEDLLPGCEEE